MTSILLIGSEGQLGRELQQVLPVGTVCLNRRMLDLTQTEQLHQTIVHYCPHLIINAAAYTAVDRAEHQPEVAHAVNGVAPTVMAEAANEIGAALIHVSTDYVFDGKSQLPYLEADLTTPINVYGRSKLAGEDGIRKECDRHIILRTAWVYGVFGKSNFVKTMLNLGATRTELQVVHDQIGTPTWAHDLAQAIATLADRCLPHCDRRLNAWQTADSGLWGTYHFTNTGAASWYDFATTIFEIAETLGFPLQVERVLPISAQAYPTAAQRPAYSVLSLKKLSVLLGSAPPPWRQSLQKMLVALHSEIYESAHPLRR